MGLVEISVILHCKLAVNDMKRACIPALFGHVFMCNTKNVDAYLFTPCYSIITLNFII